MKILMSINLENAAVAVVVQSQLIHPSLRIGVKEHVTQIGLWHG
jgi:hypothetical protein